MRCSGIKRRISVMLLRFLSPAADHASIIAISAPDPRSHATSPDSVPASPGTNPDTVCVSPATSPVSVRVRPVTSPVSLSDAVAVPPAARTVVTPTPQSTPAQLTRSGAAVRHRGPPHTTEPRARLTITASRFMTCTPRTGHF